MLERDVVGPAPGWVPLDVCDPPNLGSETPGRVSRTAAAFAATAATGGRAVMERQAVRDAHVAVRTPSTSVALESDYVSRAASR